MATKRRKGAPRPAASEGPRAAPTKKARKHFRSPADRAEELRLQVQALELLTRSLSTTQIAERLGIGKRRAARVIARAMDDYLADRDELVHKRMAQSLMQRDAIVQTWMARAKGYLKVDERGQPIMVDGRPVVVDPDPEAAMIVLRALRDQDKLIGYGQTVKVEHTGAHGGPIMTANLDARAIAQMVRESYPNAPQIILAEGETVEDVPALAAPKH